MPQKFDESEWDGPAVKADLSVEDLRKVCLMDLNGYDGQDEPVKALCKLPVKKTPDSAVNINALRAAGSEARGIGAVEKPADVPQGFYDKKRKIAANKIASLWKQAFDKDAPAMVLRIAGEVEPETDVDKVLAGLGFWGYPSENDGPIPTLREEVYEIHQRIDELVRMMEKVHSMVEEVYDLSQFG